MKGIGEYILRNRLHAVGIALLLAFLPILNAIAILILGLVTLRKGWQEGLWVLIATLVPSIAIYFFAQATLLLLLAAIFTNGMLWILAIELRRTASWAWIIQLGTLVGIAVVVIIHTLYPDVTQWWAMRLTDYFQQMKTLFAAFPVDQLSDLPQRAAKIATGAQVAMALITGLTWLVVARWWQAILFNPGQLRPELHNIRIGRSLAIGVLVILLAAMLIQASVLIDLIPVVMLPFLVAGLSFVHYFVTAKKLSVVWLVLFYILLLVVFFYMAVLLLVLGLVDSGLDLRKRVKNKE